MANHSELFKKYAELLKKIKALEDKTKKDKKKRGEFECIKSL